MRMLWQTASPNCVRRWFWLAELLWDVPWHRVFLPASTLA